MIVSCKYLTILLSFFPSTREHVRESLNNLEPVSGEEFRFSERLFHRTLSFQLPQVQLALSLKSLYLIRSGQLDVDEKASST